MEPEKADGEKLLKAISKIHTLEAQEKLIVLVKDNPQLLESKILSSLQPRIGKQFSYQDLESSKKTLLTNVRRQLLELAAEERKRDLKNAENKLTNLQQNKDATVLDNNLQVKSTSIKNRINQKMNKKVNFHSNTTEEVVFTDKRIIRRKTRKKKSSEVKRKNRQKYRANQRSKRQSNLKEKVKEIIEDNVVINLSDLEIPDNVYLFLAKGLNFVPSKGTNVHNLKFDASNFIRKLEWKAFFKQHPELQSNDNNRIHNDLLVESNKHPDFQHTCIDNVKVKLFGWIANHDFKKPKNNLTPAECQGQKWTMEKIKEKKIFVSKAEKGGATLIMNYSTVIDAIEKELFDKNKYEMLKEKTETHRNTITNKIKGIIVDLNKKNIISDKDKTMITGLNKNNHMKHSPEYRPQDPYIYPLFKVHKLKKDQITNKVTPPNRMVNAAKYGPLYRMEKWISPYLTSASQNYCKEELILDTPHLTELFKDFNGNTLPQSNELNLFTMDVEKLYPSIKSNLAIQALKDMLDSDETLDDNIKTIIDTCIKFMLEESYVTYKGKSFKAKVGIPTGGCNSRQIADIFLQWLLFKNIKPKIPEWALITFWKRFIDDVIGLWTGTKEEFNKFVKTLNDEAKLFGIHFPKEEVKFGKCVDFLDLTISLDEENKIHHKLFVKPTDARTYLNTNSFHPEHVFSSIPFSQMIRVIKCNTKEESCLHDLNELKADLIKSGYKEDILEKLQKKAFERLKTPKVKTLMDNNTVIFTLDYIEDIKILRDLISNIELDIKAVFGDIRIMLATRKCSSIGNLVVKNKTLGMINKVRSSNQQCKDKRCKICPLMITSDSFLVNNKKLVIPKNLNCKSSECIYVCVCKKCSENNAYFGQTVQEQHNRMSGHREKFCIRKYQKSALSMHAYDMHDGELTLEDFSIAVVKKVTPRRLDREEHMFIDKFDTQTKGLNRYQVI